jgi:hypothetical protein
MKSMMRRFNLVRSEDVSGMSGTGIVGEGVVLTSGRAVLTWLTPIASVAIYDSVDAMEKIHGHEGRTSVVYIDK